MVAVASLFLRMILMTLPSPRLPIDTVEQLFDKLKWEEARLDDSWSVYDSWNFVLTAHHLYHDWIGGQKVFAATPEQLKSRSTVQSEPVLEQFFFAIKNIADGSKHFDLDGAKKKQIVKGIGQREISDYDAYIFGDMIFIPYGDYHVSMSAGSAILMRCLEWIIYDGDPIVLDEMSSALDGMKIVTTR